jgi:tetratricopeptide (TPR) repeat protein
MNFRQQPARPAQLQPKVIRWRGKSWSIPDALALAVQQQRQGNFPAAAELFQLVLGKVPHSAELHNNLGVVRQQMQRWEEALASYNRALALKPDYANAHYNRGYLLKLLKRPEEALAGYDQAIAVKPDHAEAHNSRGVLLQELRRYEAALASYDRAIASNPHYAEAHNNRGTALMSLGKMPEAEKMFLKACELKPSFPDPWFNLASIRKHQNAGDAEVQRLRALLDAAGISPDAKEHLYFALGKIYDDCGLYDDAFACFQQANEIRNRLVTYNPAAVAQLTDAIREVFTKDFLAGPFAFGSESRSPIFIVGMPRSGTTLLASILSNHPAVAAAGELSTMDELAARLPELTGQTQPYPQAGRHVDAAVATRLANDYENRLRRDVGAAVPFVIDKNPLNFRHLGLIALLFPQARIIHCTRSPLDTALSNYFQRFPLQLDYAFDLQNIGHFYREYVRLMEHWRQIPNLKITEVSYTDMVLHTEATARRLLEFLGLDWDERCLAPHTNPFPVETASQWQARQPIYQDSLERWRHYEKHLGPLKEMLPA